MVPTVLPVAPDDLPDLDPATHGEEEICRIYLPWAQHLLIATIGIDAAEYAGLGLVVALREYDAARGVPFRKFVAHQVVWTAHAELARLHGREGSRRRRERRRHLGLGTTRAPRGRPARALTYRADPGQRLERRESLAQSLRSVDRLRGSARWVVLGRFLGDFDNQTLSRMLSRDQRHIAHAVSDLRRSWHTD